MNCAKTITSLAVSLMLSGAALAQGTADMVGRDVNQQNRIEQGLQKGALTSGEAAKLERQETHVETMQKNALSDGNLSPAEKARIQNAQNAASANIYKQKHDAQVGHPNSASSQRMQADVQRNANQQSRIEQGVNSGELTNKETASLERGQAHVTAREAKAGADGHVGPVEQGKIQSAENRQSDRVYHKKHNAVVKPKSGV